MESIASREHWGGVPRRRAASGRRSQREGRAFALRASPRRPPHPEKKCERVDFLKLNSEYIM